MTHNRDDILEEFILALTDGEAPKLLQSDYDEGMEHIDHLQYLGTDFDPFTRGILADYHNRWDQAFAEANLDQYIEDRNADIADETAGRLG